MRFTQLALLACACASLWTAEELIHFPDDAGVIDLTQEPYLAKGDGKTDCTDAIQRALDDYAAKNRILYLPAGKYMVSHTLVWGPSKRLKPHLDENWAAYNRHRLTILQGEQESKTIIQLIDNAPEFQDTAWRDKDERPGGTAVIWTGGWPAQRFRNAVRNLTIDTGKGNPGAIGIQFNASNQGTMHRLTVRSGDGAGQIGIDLGFCGDHGPGAGRHLTVIGFDYGIWASSMNSMTLWDVEVKKQNKAGVRVLAEELMLGDLRSVNAVPALEVGARWSSWATVVTGSFTGGAKDQPAVRIMGDVKSRHVYCRDVKVSGYGTTVSVEKDGSRDVASGDLTEWSLHGIKTLFDGDTKASLRLPIKYAPEIPLPALGKAWANPLTFGATGDGKADDTAGIQAAIDSGASTIYFPGGKEFNFTTLTIKVSTERLIGCETYLNGDAITVAEGTKPLIFERFHPTWNNGRNAKLSIECPRTVIVRDLVGIETHARSSGDVFIEDVCSTLFLHGKDSKVWCRFLNYEPNKKIGLVNDGGQLWILGSKVEHAGGKAIFKNGSRSELFGAFWYASFGSNEQEPGIEIIDSQATITTHRQHSFGKGAWANWIKVTRDGETKIWNDRNLDMLCIGK